MRIDAVQTDFNLLTDQDVYLFREGTHARLYEKMGAHLVTHQGIQGTHFAVWAPNAGSVSVVGDFNNWNPTSHPLAVRWDGSGIWEGFIGGLGRGTLYKYHVVHRDNGYTVDKGDPYAFCWEVPPRTGSVVWDLAYDWQDRAWMQARGQSHTAEASMSLYEVHLGSWRRDPSNPQRLLGYREIAQPLVDYLRHMGFTHVEFLPVMEHPFYASWGYQTVGYFAPTRRYGDAQDFMALIDLLHQNGFGVILDWVPSHFPSDQHGLSYFDGTNLYEHADPRLGFHPDWKSLIFNYGRHEVRSFLTSSAMFWLDAYHADGLRVDAVASMLYLDYSRQPGEWIPNDKGGRENLQAIHFLRGLNERIHADHPDVRMIAEESTAWPKVTGPAGEDGLGFDLKWNMGWMHDTLAYMGKDPLYRKHQHDRLTFSIWYAFTERYVLPLSHDEVVHGKGSLYERMPGDAWQKRAALRLLVGYQFTQPGKKLLFMGGEFGQHREWDHDRSLDWHLLEDPGHHGLQAWTRDLCHLYRSEPALHELDCAAEGFEWVDFHDADRSVISFLRWDRARRTPLVVVCNFTPVPRPNYRVGVPYGGPWREVVNSDARDYGGSTQGNMGEVEASPASFNGRFDHSLSIVLPPLAMVVFKGETGFTDDAPGSDLQA